MDYIKGITYGAFAGAGEFTRKQAFTGIDRLIEGTGANYIILVPNGLQDTPQSQEIDYTSPANLTDDELKKMIDYIHGKGIKVALKPTVNCKNGTWRAHICFFDKDVPCEPKWSVWFKAYTDFQLHYAAIAQETGVDLFIAGCEMVQSEHRESEWRNVISEIRKVYHGPVTYNTDKYQEDNVNWWDCVDYICSSGYYPLNDWDTQLDRIETVVVTGSQTEAGTSLSSLPRQAASLRAVLQMCPMTGPFRVMPLPTNRPNGTRPCSMRLISVILSGASSSGTGE